MLDFKNTRFGRGAGLSSTLAVYRKFVSDIVYDIGWQNEFSATDTRSILHFHLLHIRTVDNNLHISFKN